MVARLLRIIPLPTTDPTLFRPLGWTTAETQLSKSEAEALIEAMLSSSANGAADMAVEIASNWVGKSGKAALSEDLHWRVLTDRRLFSKSMDGMESHYWETLAKGFRKFYPSRDIDLLGAVLNTKNNLSAANTYSSAFEVLVDICASHPQDAWRIISGVIDHKRMGWSIRHWLGERDRGARAAEKKPEHATPIEIFNRDDIFAWVDKLPPMRAQLLIDVLPQTLEGSAGALTAGFIDRYATTEDIAHAVTSRFRSGSHMGPPSRYLSKQREEARSWLSNAKTDRVADWIGQFISHLSAEIETSKIQEERSF